jgi:protein disulfide-isomerase A6
MARMLPLLTLAVSANFLLVNADAIYTKNSPVLQVDSRSYDSLIARSNYTSVWATAPPYVIFS